MKKAVAREFAKTTALYLPLPHAHGVKASYEFPFITTASSSF